MRKTFIAGNWKMNKTQSQTKELLEEFKKIEYDSDKSDVALCFPFTSLAVARDLLKDSNISVGAQNVFYEKSGAYTGEVSTEMLEDIGVEYVIIGHSERREILGESDEMINKKLLSILESSLKPILCVGETLEERESNEYKEKIHKQIFADLEGVSKERIKDITIAYEPIWAIGTGRSASAEDAEEMCLYIREIIEEMYDEVEAQEVRIQYGGSVKPSTIKELMEKENIDGVLVGGASLKAEDFGEIINYGN